MAKVINPLMSTEARGRVGGLVFNTWRGLRTVKCMTSPSQPRTTRQLALRSILSTVSRAWSLLDSTERLSWTNFAAAHTESDWTGTPKRLTGANWFTRLTSRLLDMSKAQVDTAPVAAAPAGLLNIVATPGAGQVSIAFTAHGGTAETVDVWLGPAQSAGEVMSIERAVHKAYGPAETTPLVVDEITPGLHTAFLRVLSETDGQSSAWSSVSFTVT